MALLTILTYPDPRLYKLAAPVSVFDETLKQLVRDMAETMYEAPGVGLAATQVDVHRQLIVLDVSETHDELKVLINPRILSSAGAQICEEGCLSVPGVYEEVERAERVIIEARDADGGTFTMEAEGLFAVCIQHEMDHLDGTLFIDHISFMKGNKIKNQIKKSGYPTKEEIAEKKSQRKKAPVKV